MRLKARSRSNRAKTRRGAMSFTVIFEPDAEQEVIAPFQWYEDQSFGLGGEFFSEPLNRVKRSFHAVLSSIKFNTEKSATLSYAASHMRCTTASRTTRSHPI